MPAATKLKPRNSLISGMKAWERHAPDKMLAVFSNTLQSIPESKLPNKIAPRPHSKCTVAKHKAGEPSLPNCLLNRTAVFYRPL
jgi:hypothetical protein